jgi:prepilin-type N-terminal cleavage/methylation domain-containing protein
MRPPSRFQQKGFTLVELLMGAAIIVLLVSFLIPNFSGPKARAAQAQAIACAKALAVAEEMYYAERRTYTNDLRLLDPETIAPCARLLVVPGGATDSTYSFTVRNALASAIVTQDGIQIP